METSQKPSPLKMPPTIESEVVKSVSEVGDFEASKRELESQIKSHNDSPTNTLSNTGKSRNGSGSQILPSLINAMLPSRIGIIAGLSQVGVGGCMMLTGMLAIRYQSYMFHYGTGLWAGLLSAITGALGVMCTKNGVAKPKWLGGRKWQIHVFLLAIVFSLSSVILLGIFSISGLLQDAKTLMAVDKIYQDVEEVMKEKNSSGVLINTILLLLSVLQILLCFCSLGIAIRVMYKSKGGLLSSSKGSSGSEIVGAEYVARKDHLFQWLGHQRPEGMLRVGAAIRPTSPPLKKYPSMISPSFVAIQPFPFPRMLPSPIIPIQMPPSQFSFGPPTHTFVPICGMMPPLPPHHHPVMVPSAPGSRRSGGGGRGHTPISSIASLSLAMEHHNRRRRRQQQHYHHQQMVMGGGRMMMSPPGPGRVVVEGGGERDGENNVNNGGFLMGTSVKSFQSSKAPSILSVKTESEKNNEVEEVVDLTYNGLDRSIAEEYICAMNLRKSSHATSENSNFEVERSNSNYEENDSEAEITRM